MTAILPLALRLKSVPAAWLGALAVSAWAQPAPPPAPLPTRLQFCQRELQGMEGEERKTLLRACLLRRTEGERVVTQTCRREANEEGGPAADRARRQRDCEARALAVPSSELPQRAVASGATGGPASVMTEAASAPAMGPAPADAPAAAVEAPPAPRPATEADRRVAPVELPDRP